MPRDDEVPMEVDEPAAAGPTTPKKSILPSTPTRASIPETSFQTLCEVLDDIILPTSEDDRIQRHLGTIWYNVHEALSQDETKNTRLADEAQFLKNVNEIGKESFINLLRDMARRQSWRDLLENGTYYFRLISSTLIVPCFQRSF